MCHVTSAALTLISDMILSYLWYQPIVLQSHTQLCLMLQYTYCMDTLYKTERVAIVRQRMREPYELNCSSGVACVVSTLMIVERNNSSWSLDSSSVWGIFKNNTLLNIQVFYLNIVSLLNYVVVVRFSCCTCTGHLVAYSQTHSPYDEDYDKLGRQLAAVYYCWFILIFSCWLIKISENKLDLDRLFSLQSFTVFMFDEQEKKISDKR